MIHSRHLLPLLGTALLLPACIPAPVPAPPADTTAPTLAEVTAVPTPANDTTPSYTFSSNEAGTIIYGGSCSSATTAAIKGNTTVTFNTLADGTYSNCTIQVKDAKNNTSTALAVNTFTVDTTPPTLAQVTAVPYGKDTTPDYTFSSSEAGTIGYSGDCSSATTSASSGNNTVTFAALGYGNHENCTVTVTDAVGNVSTALAITRFAVAMKPHNDTGITLCGDMAYSYTGYTGSGTHNNNVDCAAGASPSSTATQQGFEIANGLDAVPAGQDVHFGRDANPATNSNSDGHKGFSFTKLKADGTALADQTQIWSDAGSEAAGTKWSCVQDNVTGLIWEVKTNDGGLRDKDWTYTWYNSDSSNNGGSVGTQDTGAGVGSDNCQNNARCDTAKYVTDVNAATLCGASDWRMPTSEELLSITAKDRANPAIDSNFIPNTINDWYWASPIADNSTTAWGIAFTNGGAYTNLKSNSGHVRLIRVLP